METVIKILILTGLGVGLIVLLALVWMALDWLSQEIYDFFYYSHPRREPNPWWEQ